MAEFCEFRIHQCITILPGVIHWGSSGSSGGSGDLRATESTGAIERWEVESTASTSSTNCFFSLDCGYAEWQMSGVPWDLATRPSDALQKDNSGSLMDMFYPTCASLWASNSLGISSQDVDLTEEFHGLFQVHGCRLTRWADPQKLSSQPQMFCRFSKGCCLLSYVVGTGMTQIQTWHLLLEQGTDATMCNCSHWDSCGCLFFWPCQELEIPRWPGMLSVTRWRDGSTDPPWLADAARSDSSNPSANNFQQWPMQRWSGQ